MPPNTGAIAVDGARRSRPDPRVEADRKRVDAAELLEQDGLALHHRQGRLRADVAETEHGAAVADDGDGVLLDRQRPDLGGSSAIARETRATPGVYAIERSSRVFSGVFGTISSLPPRCSEERAVGDVLDDDAVERAAPPRRSGRCAPASAREHGDVADLRAALDADEVDRVEQAVLLRDRGRERGERARAIREVDAQRCAELRRRVGDGYHGSSVLLVVVERSCHCSERRRRRDAGHRGRRVPSAAAFPQGAWGRPRWLRRARDPTLSAWSLPTSTRSSLPPLAEDEALLEADAASNAAARTPRRPAQRPARRTSTCPASSARSRTAIPRRGGADLRREPARRHVRTGLSGRDALRGRVRARTRRPRADRDRRAPALRDGPRVRTRRARAREAPRERQARRRPRRRACRARVRRRARAARPRRHDLRRARRGRRARALRDRSVPPAARAAARRGRSDRAARRRVPCSERPSTRPRRSTSSSPSTTRASSRSASATTSTSAIRATSSTESGTRCRSSRRSRPAARRAVGERVAVIGGGNTAIDVVREARRLGARDVTLVYRRTEAEMPAYAARGRGGARRGREFPLAHVPVRFLGDECRTSGASSAGGCSSARPTRAVGRGPSRFPAASSSLPVDTVVKAIGQQPRSELLDWIDGVELGQRPDRGRRRRAARQPALVRRGRRGERRRDRRRGGARGQARRERRRRVPRDAAMKEIRWHARAGQGAKTASQLLAVALLESGKSVQAFPEYGPERRGAPLRAFTRYDDRPIRRHDSVTRPTWSSCSSRRSCTSRRDGGAEARTALVLDARALRPPAPARAPRTCSWSARVAGALGEPPLAAASGRAPSSCSARKVDRRFDPGGSRRRATRWLTTAG